MTKREADLYVAHNSPSVAKAISTYLSDEMWQSVRSWARRPRYSVTETDISSRVVSHWEEKKLLPEGISGSGGWRKFTPTEAAWLKVVNRLRSFGLSLEKIVQVKDSVMRWDETTGTYPMFEFHFVSAALTGYDPYIVVFSDGSALLANSIQIEEMKTSDNSSDMLLISLKSVAREIGMPAARTKQLHPLSDGEPELLAEVRTADDREVNVKVKKGKIKELETKTRLPDTSTLRSIEEALEKQGAFADMSIRYTDGKKRSVELKTRKRIGHQSS